MNLTPANWKKSVVEENKEFVKIGMKLWYTDASQCERFTVVGVSDEQMILIDETGAEFEMDFNGLQIGWDFSNKDMEFIEAVKAG